jgi:transposase
LSPYSPDFSPIENLWSKLKNILRSIKTTNYQELGKAIEFAFNEVTEKIFGIGLLTAVIVPHLYEKGYN